MYQTNTEAGQEMEKRIKVRNKRENNKPENRPIVVTFRGEKLRLTMVDSIKLREALLEAELKYLEGR